MMPPKIELRSLKDHRRSEPVAISISKGMKWLCMVFFFFSLSSQAYATNQAIDLIRCCGQRITVEDASERQALMITCLMENQWIEAFDEKVATSHRILRFVEQGVLEITTIFSGGFAESEDATWEFITTEQGDFLSIVDPVLGESVLYKFKIDDLGIQLTESGHASESTLYYRAPIPSLNTYSY